MISTHLLPDAHTCFFKLCYYFQTQINHETRGFCGSKYFTLYFKYVKKLRQAFAKDRYHFFETDIDIFNIFSPIFGQLPVFEWPPIPIFQNCCQYFTKVFWLKLVRIAYRRR